VRPVSPRRSIEETRRRSPTDAAVGLELSSGHISKRFERAQRTDEFQDAGRALSTTKCHPERSGRESRDASRLEVINHDLLHRNSAILCWLLSLPRTWKTLPSSVTRMSPMFARASVSPQSRQHRGQHRRLADPNATKRWRARAFPPLVVRGALGKWCPLPHKPKSGIRCRATICRPMPALVDRAGTGPLLVWSRHCDVATLHFTTTATHLVVARSCARRRSSFGAVPRCAVRRGRIMLPW